jgi:hypothetical protein
VGIGAGRRVPPLENVLGFELREKGSGDGVHAINRHAVLGSDPRNRLLDAFAIGEASEDAGPDRVERMTPAGADVQNDERVVRAQTTNVGAQRKGRGHGALGSGVDQAVDVRRSPLVTTTHVDMPARSIAPDAAKRC